MAAPIKSLISATKCSYSSYTFMRSNITKISDNANIGRLYLGVNPVLNDPLTTKYAIRAIPLFISTASSKQKMGSISFVVVSSRYMVINTFPAAYQKAKIRPSFGQLWPRSGAIPW